MAKGRLKNWLKRLGISAGIGIILFVAFYLAMLKIYPFPYQEISAIKYSKTILDKDGNLLRAFLGKEDSWLLEIELDEINPNFIKATLAIEDKRFMKHSGIDVAAVFRAAKQNLLSKRIISGASTISMQVMRLLLPKKRTLWNKIVETVHTIRLEALYSKQDILKLYFELAPYGGNILGVKAASLRYFKKYPQDLNLSECALLAGLPQSPSRLRPDRYPKRAKIRRDQVLLSMFKNKYISQEQFKRAKNEPIVAGTFTFPFKAPHFARHLKNKYPQKHSIVTTLDSNIQHLAETTLKDTIRQLRSQGITNGAIVVIENKSGKVRALVGSNDFFSFKDCGQINGALSLRCPGSALKPFTYVLGIDKGLYTPRMILADVPVQYSGYTPRDYDKKYRGPVMVREALVDSLNIPAVEALDRGGYRSLYFFLKDIGISTINKLPENYGLSLTLGSGEVNLLELTNAYASLARGGVYEPCQLIEDDKLNKTSKRVVSEGATYIISDILSDSTRLESVGIYRDDKIHPKIAFKTGTSFGHRDAWTISYNPEYTVGVWLGNFSAKPSKALVGIEVATPIAVHIFDRLYAKKSSPWYAKPNEVGERYVCALSGEPVNEFCEHSVKDLYLKNKSIAKKCTFHKKIAIDIKTELALDDYAKQGRDYIEEVFVIWPDKLQSWIRQHNPEYLEPPEYMVAPKRIVNLDKNRPKIVLPLHKCEYFISGPDNFEQKLTLAANGSFDTDKLYWFINDNFFSSGKIGEKLFWAMKKGRYKITCVDKQGRSSFIRIVVR